MRSIADKTTFFEAEFLQPVQTPIDQLYTEAVFTSGKEKIAPIEAVFGEIQEELKKQISQHTKEKPFDNKAFWRNSLWKKLEDNIQKVFNFRMVSVNPFLEKYLEKDKQFESKMLNALVYNTNRFPIDGLVTDKGFWDSTKSTQLEIWVSLGLIRDLSPAEITAVFLHEFGHGIDPALVDIKYTEVNVLSKYLTDRKKEVKQGEKKALEADNKKINFVSTLNKIQDVTKNFASFLSKAFEKMEKRFDSFTFPWDTKNAKLKKIKKALEKDNSVFRRQDYSEAYADNFARMYGYGPALATGFKKVDKDLEANWINNRYKHEGARQRAIVSLIVASINDEHKTSLHRVLALKRDMTADINDPNTPPKVKEQLKEDLNELNKVLEAYQNDFSDFQNSCNKLLIESIGDVKEPEAPKTDETPSEEKK